MPIPDPHEVDTVLYHANCMDGWAAAYAAWKLLGDSAEYIPVQYGEDPPCVEGRTVAILDFSFSRDVLEKMNSAAKGLIVLDHHKTAQADLDGLDYAIFDMEKSGCVLAFEWFDVRMKLWRIPMLLCHIQDRDLWQWKLQGTREISEALWLLPREFEAFDAAVQGDTNTLVAQGATIRTYVDRQVNILANQAVLVTLRDHGARFWMINAPAVWASDLGQALYNRDDVIGAAMIWFHYPRRGCHICSLRSRTGGIDVSAVAKAFGGGGHHNAAGFRWERPISDLVIYS